MSYQALMKILSIFSILSIFLMAVKLPLLGFTLGSFVSIGFIYYFYKTNQKPLIYTSIAYLISEILGIINWHS